MWEELCVFLLETRLSFKYGRTKHVGRRVREARRGAVPFKERFGPGLWRVRRQMFRNSTVDLFLFSLK